MLYSPNLNLTPKAKVWKVLKKVKKNWSHELKRVASHYNENVRCQGERETENHWHTRPETYPLHWDDNA